MVLVLALCGMAGQWFAIPVLTTLAPGLPPMRMEAGVALLLLAGALRLLLTTKEYRPLHFLARLAALSVFVGASLVILDHAGIFSLETGWRWANRIPSPDGATSITSKTAGTFILAALALMMMLGPGQQQRQRPAQWLAIAVLISGVWTLLGYLFSAGELTEMYGYNRAPLHTALGMIILGVGILLARPESGAMAIFSSNSAAGQMARKILPAGLLMLFVLGATITLGQRLQWYTPAFSDALFTLATLVLFTILVWRNAHEIGEAEQVREETEHAARHQREWFQVMLSSIADAVIATDKDGRVQFINRVAHTLTGWSNEEAVGRPAGEVFQLLHIKDGTRLECPTERVLHHGEVTGHPEFATLLTRAGTQIPVEDKASPIRDTEGDLIGCVVVFRDVTDRRRAEEMRREVARHYATVAEAIPQMVWTAQADGSLDFFNRRWQEYTGMTVERSSGWRWLSAFHEEDRLRCEEAWRVATSTKSRYEVAGRIRRKDGSLRWHLVRALPVIDQHGEIDKWFGTCTDIDDQKRAEEAVRFLADASTVLSASQDEISTLQSVAELAVPKLADLCTVHLALDSPQGEERQLLLAAVSHMDPKRVELMVEIDRRFPPESRQTKGVTHVLRTGMAEMAAELDGWMLDGLSSNHEHRRLLGELGVRSSMMVPLQGHRDLLGVMSFLSIESGRRYTSRDLSMAEEMARRTALALENNRLLAEITATKVEAEEANAAKDEFLAVLSHELRTPLTPVLLAVDDLSRDKTLTPPLRNVMEMTRRNIELEARLIDDLLDLTRIQRGKLQLQMTPLDAHALLKNALEICNGDIASKHLCITLELPATGHHVNADPARLQQVFWNLIKNSVKFTPEGGSITFRSRNPQPGILEIEVEDTGIGIEEEAIGKVFNAFEQGEASRGRRFGGLGLGLAITRNLVEAHGGDISVTSEGRDKGATFTLRLATCAQPLPSEGGNPTETGEARPVDQWQILLVEDNVDTGGLLLKILTRRGYDVKLVTSVAEALEEAGRSEYHLLISDIGLPDGSGLELMQKLKECHPMPGIAMSGFGMDEDIRRSREAGFIDHLTKPVSISKLDEAIKKLARGGTTGE